VRILSLFMLNPASEFYLREISRRLNLPPYAVTQETKRLTEIDLLRRERRGNNVFFRVNRHFSIFPELKAIILRTVGIGDRLRGELTKLGNVEVAFIYGSYAKGTENLDSDVDVFIIGDLSQRQLNPVLSQLEEEMGRELNATLFAREEVRQRMNSGDHFVSSVMADRKIFLIANEEVLRSIAEG